jgi:hypothetical protein
MQTKGKRLQAPNKLSKSQVITSLICSVWLKGIHRFFSESKQFYLLKRLPKSNATNQRAWMNLHGTLHETSGLDVTLGLGGGWEEACAVGHAGGVVAEERHAAESISELA